MNEVRANMGIQNTKTNSHKTVQNIENISHESDNIMSLNGGDFL